MIQDPTNILRYMLESDLELVRSWRNHDAIRAYMFDQQLINSEEHLAWFDKAKRDALRELFIFEHKAVPQGFVQVKYSHAYSVAEWGFYAAPEAPAGSGTNMLRKVLQHVFAVKGSIRVYAQVLGYNLASLHLHEKLGFTCEGILRSHYYDGVRRCDVHCFGILSSEWNKPTES